MARRILALVAVLALSVSGVALAAQGKKHKPKSHKTSGTIYAAAVHQKSKSVSIAGGEIVDKVLGEGAITFAVKATPDNGKFHVDSKPVTVYTKKGSLTGSASVTFDATTNPPSFADGKFKLAKGTGGYKGWKFTGTFTGDLVDNVYKFDYKGKVTH